MLASLFSFGHNKSIGKSSMTKNMTTTSMLMSRSRSRMSHSPRHVFPLLPKSLFTISEDDNSNTIEPQGSISDSAFNSTSRTICSPLALHGHHNFFSLYYNDDDDDDDDSNSSNSNSTPSNSHADILTSVFDTLSAFDDEDDNEDEEEQQQYLSSRHEVSRWNTGEYTHDNSISCNTTTSRTSHHMNKNWENHDTHNTTSTTSSSTSSSSSCPLSSSSRLSSTLTPTSYHNRDSNSCVVGIDRPPTRPTRSRRGSCQF
mmetsp:Transcript_13400/g.14711  ORF Transcript_13400/g.14711 Transcript_13400/m.14711 type:complete len:258 (+) Transcript_13400:143-916(+)